MTRTRNKISKFPMKIILVLVTVIKIVSAQGKVRSGQGIMAKKVPQVTTTTEKTTLAKVTKTTASSKAFKTSYIV